MSAQPSESARGMAALQASASLGRGEPTRRGREGDLRAALVEASHRFDSYNYCSVSAELLDRTIAELDRLQAIEARARKVYDWSDDPKERYTALHILEGG